MKRLFTGALCALIISLMFVACNSARTGSGRVEEMEVLTDIDCEICVEHVREALAYVKGVKSMELNTETQKLSVQFNPAKTRASIIMKAISKAGFDAGDFEADSKAYEKLPECCQNKMTEKPLR